nr:MAG TPA: hypothetical protein [Bacteriophage sp.]
MKKALEEIREKERRNNAAYDRLRAAGYSCWGDSYALMRRGISRVLIEQYRAGENPATVFPERKWYFRDYEEAAAALLDSREGERAAE